MTQLVLETRTFGRVDQQSRIRSEMGCNVKILRKIRQAAQGVAARHPALHVIVFAR